MNLRSRSSLFAVSFLAAFAPSAPAQESKAVFDAPLVMWPGDNRVEHLLDLDQDGWDDALSWWYTSSGSQTIRVRGWMNDRAGATIEAWQFTLGAGPGGNNPGHLAIGDLDGDGRTDFAVEFRRAVQFWSSNGAAPPALLSSMTTPRDVKDFHLTDIDGNGLADLVYLTTNGEIHAHLNQGPALGHAQVETSDTDVDLPKSVLRIGELSGDSVPDLLLVYQQEIRMYPLAANGTVGAPNVIPTVSFWSIPRPVIGDVDGDLDPDVAVFDGYGAVGFYELVRRTGRGSWSLEPTQLGGPVTELADIDLDGDLDGICCGGGPSCGTWLNALKSTFNICMNLDGQGTFSPSFQMRGVGSTHIAGATDFDHDGDIDLVAGRVIYYARGTDAWPPVHSVDGALASQQSLVDFDTDGDIDLNLEPSSVVKSDGQSIFASATAHMPAPPPGSTWFGPGYPGDFDGDGDADLIVARWDGGVFARMELLANLGGGHFVDAGAAGAPGVSFSLTGDQTLVPRGALVADLDADGDLDLLTRKVQPASGSSTKTWLNDGDGFFTLAWSDASVALALGDTSGDGIPDLVFGYDSTTTSIFWRLGVGNGTFGQLASFSQNYFLVEADQDEVVLADLDADGDRDLIGISHSQNFNGEAYMWRNNGGSPGGWPQTYPFGLQHETVCGGAVKMLAADVNADGWDDLLSWPPQEALGACYVILRTSNGADFQPPILQGLQPLAFADVDGDGDPDSIGLSWTSFSNQLVKSAAITGSDVGARRQYGEGSPGMAGYAPVLGAVGPFRVGEPIEIRVRGGVGGAKAFLAVGTVESAIANTPFTGMTAYASPAGRRILMTLSGPAGVAGVGSATLSVTVMPELAGRTLYHQAYVLDRKVSVGLSCTNGLEIAYD